MKEDTTTAEPFELIEEVFPSDLVITKYESYVVEDTLIISRMVLYVLWPGITEGTFISLAQCH